MEGVQTSTGTITVKLADLSPAQRQIILESRPELYKVDDTTNLTELCSLRGQDVPSKFAGSHMKDACVVITRKDLDTAGGKFSFVGPSIDVSKLDPEGMKIAAPLDRINVRFHLDTQTPNVEISTGRAGTGTTNPNGLISTRLYAQDLCIYERTCEVMIFARPSSNGVVPNRFETKRRMPGNADVAELKSILEQKRLFEVMLVIKQDRPASTWVGIEHSVTSKIVSGAASKDAGTPDVATRDLLIRQKGQKDTNVIPFFTMIKEDQINSMLGRMKDIVSLFSVAARYGIFWFYRRQLSLKNIKADMLETSDLPKINFEVTRWLVTEFTFDTTEDDKGELKFSKPGFTSGRALSSQGYGATQMRLPSS